MCLRVLVAILCSPCGGDIPLQIGLRRGVSRLLFPSEMPMGGRELAQSEVRKYKLDGFSSSC